MRLSDQQLEMMRVLWREGQSSVAEVQAGLGTELAYTTVATVLGRLERAGAVRRERGAGRGYVYAAEVTEAMVKRSMTKSLINRLFGGDPQALLTHLVSEDEFSSEDLERLEALLEAGAPVAEEPEDG